MAVNQYVLEENKAQHIHYIYEWAEGLSLEVGDYLHVDGGLWQVQAPYITSNANKPSVDSIDYGSCRLPVAVVDHADTSPVNLGTIPALTWVQLFVACQEIPAGPPALTFGDSGDTDKIFTYAELPKILNGTVISAWSFYETETDLLATISGAGSAGQWRVAPFYIRGS